MALTGACPSLSHAQGADELTSTGCRYQTRLFSRKWLESKELLQFIPQEHQHLITLP